MSITASAGSVTDGGILGNNCPMNKVKKVSKVRLAVVSAVVGATLTVGSSLSAWSWMPHQARSGPAETAAADRSYTERVNSDGTCDLVDAQGVPLYDSQFTERTGSSPCDQG